MAIHARESTVKISRKVGFFHKLHERLKKCATVEPSSFSRFSRPSSSLSNVVAIVSELLRQQFNGCLSACLDETKNRQKKEPCKHMAPSRRTDPCSKNEISEKHFVVTAFPTMKTKFTINQVVTTGKITFLKSTQNKLKNIRFYSQPNLFSNHQPISCVLFSILTSDAVCRIFAPLITRW